MTSADVLTGLVAGTLAGSAAIAIVLLLRPSVRQHFGPSVAYGLWGAVPVSVVIALLPAAPKPIMVAAKAFAILPPAASVAANSAINADLRPLVLALWIVGASIFAARTGALHFRFLKSLGVLTRVGPDVLRAATNIGTPALIGVFRPTIVVPVDFESRFEPAEQDLVLAHERAHRLRGDAQANLVATVACCLNWFNPLVQSAVSRFRLDQELACDAAVLRRFAHGRRIYAEAMLKTQIGDCGFKDLQLACMWPTAHLKERIAMLKIASPNRTRRTLGFILVTTISVLVASAAWAASQALRPARIDAPAGTQVDAQLTLTLGDGAPKHVHLLNPVGVPFSVKDDGPSAWQAEFVGAPVEGGGIELDATFTRGDKVVAKPMIVAKPGEPASIEITDPSGSGTLRLEATLALVEGKATTE
jgi:beta-lactamase regulating signal transducer with metallopeptidase domain